MKRELVLETLDMVHVVFSDNIICIFFSPAYYVAFGPHGPRAPVSPPGQGTKIFVAITTGVIIAGALSYAIRVTGSRQLLFPIFLIA